MKVTELREVVVFYCDVCHQEVHGTMTTRTTADGVEAHACHRWIESEGVRCDHKLDSVTPKQEGV